MRPNGFKTIAILGIFVNTIGLCISYPILISIMYNLRGNLDPFEVFMLFISIPIGIIITSILLLGSIGLLQRREWARKLCVIGLCMNIGFYTCETIVNILYSLTKWNAEVINTLIVVPFIIALLIIEACIVLYLRSAETKNYLNP